MIGIYFLGMASAYAANVARISSLFWLGDRASSPGQPEWVESLRGTPVVLFHSYAGWLLDLLVFLVLALVLRRGASRRRVA